MYKLKKIENKINSLIVERDKINIEINKLTNIKKAIELEKIFKSIKINTQNKELFAYYLMEIKNLKDSSIDKYYNSLLVMKELVEKHFKIKINCELYFIDDEKIFKELIELFKSQSELVKINLKRHHDISAAFNNYYNFLISMKKFN